MTIVESKSVSLPLHACSLPKQALTADRFLMVTPSHLDACKCPDNMFTDLADGVDQHRAIDQHAQVVELLRSLGKDVQVFSGRSADDTFCNNIFATNHRRLLVIGNMFYPARQMEGERDDIRHFFMENDYSVIELSAFTKDAGELTGMLIIDHAWNIGFCGLSNRCTLESAQIFQQLFGLKLVYTFPISIYHSNVGLSILAGKLCVICPEMFVHREDAEGIMKMYPDKVILTAAQMNEFAGNILAVSENDMVMSSRGYRALTKEQIHQFRSADFNIHHVELSEIEKSGGSMRCLLAEVF